MHAYTWSACTRNKLPQANDYLFDDDDDGNEGARRKEQRANKTKILTGQSISLF
jgi:hypothetical protein